MFGFKEIRIGSQLWMTLSFCVCYLIVYFYLFLFEIVIIENFGYKIFDDEIGALCHMVLSVIGTCTVLYLCTYIEEINLKYPKKEEKEKEKKGIKEDLNN